MGTLLRKRNNVPINVSDGCLENEHKQTKQVNFSNFVPEILQAMSSNKRLQKEGCSDFLENALTDIMNQQSSPQELSRVILPFRTLLSPPVISYFELLSSHSVKTETSSTDDTICLQKDKLESLLNNEDDDEKGFNIVKRFLNSVLEKQNFDLLSPACFLILVDKLSVFVEEKQKILRQIVEKLLEHHPQFGSYISNEATCLYLLTASNDRHLISHLIKTSATFQKTAQTHTRNLQSDVNSPDYLFFASQTVLGCEDEEYRAAVAPMYWSMMSGWLVGEIESNYVGSGIGEAGAVLLEKGHVALKKLSELVKSMSKLDSRPSLHRQDASLRLFRCVEKKRCSLRILRITLNWLKLDLAENKDGLQLAKFITSFLNHFDSLDLEEVIDESEFFAQLLNVALSDGKSGKDLLSLLTILCQKANKFPAKDVHSQVVGHSDFFKIMLKGTAESEPLVDLLLALTPKDALVCKENHIALFLSAYGGTMSVLDQKILCLIKLYADYSVNMTKYRPFLWGKPALSHYSSLHRHSESLFKQPKQQDVLGLFAPEMIERTVLSLPLDLGLVPSVNTAIDQSLSHKIYDLRFFLPLLASLLSSGSYVQCKNFIDSQCLRLLFACLASTQNDTRSLAYHCLAQFYFHLQAAPSQERHLWLCLLDSLRNSIESENQRIPFVIALFAGRVAQIFTEPDHKLYQVLSQFIMVKPNLDIGQIPEFYNLFNSTGLEHRSDRLWMLHLLSEGMRTSSDFHLCEKRYVSRTLMMHYASCMATREEKAAILRFLQSAVQIEPAARKLYSAGLMPWLVGILEQGDKVSSSILKAVNSIVEDLRKTIDISEAELSLIVKRTQSPR